jgi:hypothetical protein
MPVSLASAGGGSVTLTPASTASAFTATLPAGTGTVAVQGVSSNIVQGTAVTSASGTSIDFTSVPSWAKRITIMFAGISTNGSSQVQVQCIAGSAVTTGYASTTWEFYASSSSSTVGFNLDRAGGTVSASTTRSGTLVLTLLSPNIWTASGNIARTDNSYTTVVQGSISLGSALTGVRLTTVNGTDAFDAGAVNILYE